VLSLYSAHCLTATEVGSEVKVHVISMWEKLHEYWTVLKQQGRR